MPVYNYQCQKCKTNFEKIQPIAKRKTCECPECGNMADLKLSVSNIFLKTDTWLMSNSWAKDRTKRALADNN